MNTTKAAAAVLMLALAWVALPSRPARLSLSVTANISFGRFVAGSGGQVTVAPTGLRSRSGGVVLLPSPVSAAGFAALDQNPNAANDIVILTLPGNGMVTLRSGANSMAVTGFTSNRPPSAVLGRGTQAFKVGATLQVAAGQPPGNYSGQLPVTIEYQ